MSSIQTVAVQGRIAYIAGSLASQMFAKSGEGGGGTKSCVFCILGTQEGVAHIAVPLPQCIV